MISAHMAAMVETTFDVVFFVEFLCRITPFGRPKTLGILDLEEVFYPISTVAIPLLAGIPKDNLIDVHKDYD